MRVIKKYGEVSDDVNGSQRIIGLSTQMPTKKISGFVILDLGHKIPKDKSPVSLPFDIVLLKHTTVMRIALTPSEAVKVRDMLNELIKNAITK